MTEEEKQRITEFIAERAGDAPKPIPGRQQGSAVSLAKVRAVLVDFADEEANGERDTGTTWRDALDRFDNGFLIGDHLVDEVHSESYRRTMAAKKKTVLVPPADFEEKVRNAPDPTPDNDEPFYFNVRPTVTIY